MKSAIFLGCLDVCTHRSYNNTVRLEWDEAKNQSNIRKHGLDFKDAFQIFSSPMLVRLDTRYNYDEVRWIGIGIIQNRVVVIVYVELPDGETKRVISLRKALAYERKRFEDYF